MNVISIKTEHKKSKSPQASITRLRKAMANKHYRQIDSNIDLTSNIDFYNKYGRLPDNKEEIAHKELRRQANEDLVNDLTRSRRR